MDNPNFNMVMFRIVSKWAGADPDGVRLSNFKKLKGPMEKIKRVQEAIEDGGLNVRETNCVVGVVMAEIEAIERTELAEDVRELKRLNDIK
jgi:hypothetical protein